MYQKIALAILFLMSGLDIFAQGCSTCRAQIESANGTSLTVGNGLNNGIYILMAVPYIVLFFIFRKQLIKFIKGTKVTH